MTKSTTTNAPDAAHRMFLAVRLGLEDNISQVGEGLRGVEDLGGITRLVLGPSWSRRVGFRSGRGWRVESRKPLDLTATLRSSM